MQMAEYRFRASADGVTGDERCPRYMFMLLEKSNRSGKRWTRYVARIREARNAYKIVDGKALREETIPRT
jgi:hypothetical protein